MPEISRHGLAGTTATLLHAAVVVAVVALLQRPAGSALALLAAAGAALALLPVTAWLRAAIDARAARERYPYAEGLGRVGLRIAQATSLSEVGRVLEAALVDVLPVARGYLYVLEGEPEQRLRRLGHVETGTSPAEPMPLRCEVEQFPAVAAAIAGARPTAREDARGEGGASLWNAHGVDLVVPALLGDPKEPQVRGLLVLGPKRVGGPYDAQDRALLLDLGRHFAVAIANAAVIARIREDRNGLFEQTGALSSALTDLRNVQDQLLEAEKQAIEEEKQAALGRLAAGIVHEINTPLGTIASSIDTAGRAAKRFRPYVAGRAEADADDAAAAKALRAIDAQGQSIEVLAVSEQRIGSVIDSLKRFVGLDAAEIKPLDICQSIDDAITLIKGTVGDQIRIGTRFPDERPVVHCRAAKLNQVILNLIENAAKAIEGEGAIDITVTRREREARVEIRDSGCGMDEKRLQQVLDFGFTMKTGRVGMRTALPGSRIAIQELGGSLTVSSAPGEGTAVVIELPCEVGG